MVRRRFDYIDDDQSEVENDVNHDYDDNDNRYQHAGCLRGTFSSKRKSSPTSFAPA